MDPEIKLIRGLDEKYDVFNNLTSYIILSRLSQDLGKESNGLTEQELLAIPKTPKYLSYIAIKQLKDDGLINLDEDNTFHIEPEVYIKIDEFKNYLTRKVKSTMTALDHIDNDSAKFILQDLNDLFDHININFYS